MKRRRIVPGVICAAALVLAAIPIFGQKDERAGPRWKVVSMVATVRDSHGKIVNDLKADDFVLEEDGRPQTFTFFQAKTDVPLTLGLLVDTNPGQRKALEQERAATGKLVDTALREDKDSGFLIHFDRDAELLQDITKSRQKLQDAISGLQAMQLEQVGQRGGEPRPGERDDDSRGQNGREDRGFRGPRSLLYDSLFLANDELLKNQQGRKVIVLMSDGVDRGSKTTLEEAMESAQRANTTVYTVYFASEKMKEPGDRGKWGQGRVSGPWPLPGSGGGRPGGGYPGGGGQSGGGRAPQVEEPQVDGKKILERIARATGGRMFEISKKESLEQVYQEIQEELSNEYLLSYKPSRAEDEIRDYHKILLTTKNKDLAVQVREGYYAAVVLPQEKEAK